MKAMKGPAFAGPFCDCSPKSGSNGAFHDGTGRALSTKSVVGKLARALAGRYAVTSRPQDGGVCGEGGDGFTPAQICTNISV